MTEIDHSIVELIKKKNQPLKATCKFENKANGSIQRKESIKKSTINNSPGLAKQKQVQQDSHYTMNHAHLFNKLRQKFNQNASKICKESASKQFGKRLTTEID